MEKNFEAHFVYASDDKEYFVKRVSCMNPNDDELKSFYDYLQENNLNPNNTGYVFMSELNILSAMVEPFWSCFTKEEKIEILKIAMNKYGCKPYDECKEYGLTDDGSVSPIYTDGEHIYLNTTALNYEIDPCFYLSTILSAKDEMNQSLYEERTNKPNNILEIENIQELKTRYVLSSIDMKTSEEEEKEWLESFYADMPILRARNYAILSAVEMLLDEADTLRPVSNKFIDDTFSCAEHVLSNLRTIHSTLDATDEELATIQELEFTFNERPKDLGAINYMNEVVRILKISDRRRDAWYVLQVNDLLNSEAEKDGRKHDIISQEDALAHFSLNMNDVVLDTDFDLEESEDENDDDLDNEDDGPIYTA